MYMTNRRKLVEFEQFPNDILIQLHQRLLWFAFISSFDIHFSLSGFVAAFSLALTFMVWLLKYRTFIHEITTSTRKFTI